MSLPGLPTIVNANGSMAEMPGDAVYMLPDEFKADHLKEALEDLWRDEGRRFALGRRAREVIAVQYSPRDCADRYAEAIERYYGRARKGRSALVNAVAGLEATPVCERDILELARCIAQNHPLPSEKQFLVDVSAIVRRDPQVGVDQAERGVLEELLDDPPQGYRVEPVYAAMDKSNYRYARRFTLGLLNCPDQILNDDPVKRYDGDIFLGFSINNSTVLKEAAFYSHLKHIGVRVYFLIYDLEWFERKSSIHEQWLCTFAASDGAICVSRSVAEDLLQLLDATAPGRSRSFPIGIWKKTAKDLADIILNERWDLKWTSDRSIVDAISPL